ncbi:MAG: DUF58 domain-containing protein [Verrucomicrobiota bacterium]
MAQLSFKYLKPEDIRRLASFEFAPKLLAEGYLSGKHKSKARGSSIEFHDYRQYVPGDDLALVDWRVFARTDRHYLRTFEQEINLECNIFLDCSASMAFGNRLTKLEYASFFVAALAYIVHLSRDRVSLQLFDDKIRAWFPPSNTSKHLINLMHALENNQPGGPTSAAEALRRSVPLLKRRGTLVIVSDFLSDPGEMFSALNPYLHRGFRIYLFQILDPAEIELEGKGLATFVDMESRDRLVAHSENLRENYRQLMQEHTRNLRSLATRRGVAYRLCRTNESFLDLFDTLLK